MSRDSVWEELKEDDTKVYGEPIMDMFLKMTDEFSLRHWESLDEPGRCSIGPGAVLGVLLDSMSEENDPEQEGEPFRKAIKSMCKEALGRLQGEHLERLMDRMAEKKLVMDAGLLGDIWGRIDAQGVSFVLCHASNVFSREVGSGRTQYLREMLRLFRPRLKEMDSSMIATLISDCGFDIDLLDAGVLSNLRTEHVLSILTSTGHNKVIWPWHWGIFIGIAKKLRASGVQSIWRIDEETLKSRLKSRVRDRNWEDLYEKIMDSLGKPGEPL